MSREFNDSDHNDNVRRFAAAENRVSRFAMVPCDGCEKPIRRWTDRPQLCTQCEEAAAAMRAQIQEAEA